MIRVAVVDIGTNSTRLLIADVDPATQQVTELDRRTTVTRLGDKVDTTGELQADAMDRVFTTLDGYKQAIDEHDVQRTIAVLTSATRDAKNGQGFTATVRDTYDLDARTLTGEQEATLTYLGATSSRDAQASSPVVVIDIGGGSTEFVIGTGHQVTFHASTQAGAVRQSERHVHSDPPRPEELQKLAQDVQAVFANAVPASAAAQVKTAIAVAGTATSLAAIAQDLNPYDPSKVHGYRLGKAEVGEILARLAQMDLEERRRVPGLHPDRAPTIVPGCVLMAEALKLFDLDEVEVSEHDILRGAAIKRATE